MSRLHPLLFVPLWLLLAACASSPPTLPATVADARPTLLLVSLDGVHPDMLGRGDTPHLDRMAREGVRAQWMRPSYPSLTFPNHYTLVTGLRPDRHGLIHNTMQTDALGWFRLSDRDAVGNTAWWQGEPLWVTAENAGLPTATLFWPGSEAPVQGVRPTRWNLFDATLSMDERVARVLGWLAEPNATRPRLATLYFEHPDSAGHAHGPRSAQLRATLREVDAAIGRLLAGIAEGGLQQRVNLVVVSDHGMAEVPEGQVVAVEDMVDPIDAEAISHGQVLGFRPRPERQAQAEAALLGAHDRYDCWRKHELPARWHYGSHPRIPPIVCQMHEGWDAIPRESLARRPGGMRGSHGFDPALPSMRAIFIAQGPAFRSGVTLPAFDNVDVYALLARLLGVEPAPNDGDPETLAPALRRP
ncbi:ectonucleotide pyrophosphatase/phosphodiesterase [Luteimonas suaedae]|uniref:alkaline phosphatase family protein n=1 Tax=Luteimonas suaedae TaxID=2605430 RepID=UPI0011EEC412|nr:ectonucleotide pyrophosphatase/phosphodiesterase [Luteimonas suaedae]